MLTSILLQAAQGQGSAYGNLILIGGIVIVFYFFMIRPQQKKQKDQKKFIDDVKKGDMVVTIGGLHGKVYSIDGDTVVLDVDKGTKMKFEKTSISLEASKQYADSNKSESN
jgi:preprotein translocase subunit YajC